MEENLRSLYYESRFITSKLDLAYIPCVVPLRVYTAFRTFVFEPAELHLSRRSPRKLCTSKFSPDFITMHPRLGIICLISHTEAPVSGINKDLSKAGMEKVTKTGCKNDINWALIGCFPRTFHWPWPTDILNQIITQCECFQRVITASHSTVTLKRDVVQTKKPNCDLASALTSKFHFKIFNTSPTSNKFQ